MNNYLPGDELFIFGFSRGAFTARVLAGLIIKLGIFRTTYLSDFKEAFKAYRTSVVAWRDYLKTHDLHAKESPRTQRAIIKVVGCWDTVGSVGLPVVQPIFGYFSGSSGVYDPGLLGGTSAPFLAQIENAFHALALDEYRRPFSPTLWYLPENSKGQCSFISPFAFSNIITSWDSQSPAMLVPRRTQQCRWWLCRFSAGRPRTGLDDRSLLSLPLL